MSLDAAHLPRAFDGVGRETCDWRGWLDRSGFRGWSRRSGCVGAARAVLDWVGLLGFARLGLLPRAFDGVWWEACGWRGVSRCLPIVLDAGHGDGLLPTRRIEISEIDTSPVTALWFTSSNIDRVAHDGSLSTEVTLE